MSDAAALVLDLALRGAVCALLLLVAAVLLRDYGRERTARLGSLFAVGGAAHAIASAAGFRPELGWWAPPLIALSNVNNPVLWLLAQSLFDDGFRLRAWHAAVCAVVMVASLVGCLWLWPTHSPFGPALDTALTWTALGFALLAAVQTLASWPADLVEQRRRLRVVIIAGSAVYTGLTAVARLTVGHGPGSPTVDLLGAAGLALVSAAIAWSLLRTGDVAILFGAEATPAEPVIAPLPASPALDAADHAHVAALEQAMTHDRAYRREGLTIGQLAARLSLPEHKLRRLINQGLGHRNFNSFLNRYRIGDAKAALSDPTQAEVPILTIALDAGFNSLGPFNRAFKAETGLTPTEFRRGPTRCASALADFENGERVSVFGDSAFEIGAKPAKPPGN